MKVANNWKDYEILDMANGEKLERWNNIYLVRFGMISNIQKNGSRLMHVIIEVVLVVDIGIIRKGYQIAGKLSIRI